MSSFSDVTVHRGLGGDGDKKNDVLYVKPKAEPAADRSAAVVVFFGGDVQDFEAAMLAHRDNGRYAAEWSLEKTARLLSAAHPSSSVVVVRPRSLEYGTFSRYSNFVESDGIGSPKHSKDQGAVRHLEALVRSLSAKESSLDPEGPKTLVGFSKGVVVLNQLVHEMAEPDCPSFAETVGRMCWLDGGHNGGRETWITDAKVLEEGVAKRGVAVDVRVTPYQIRDERRPWIRKEEKKFTATLKRLGADVTRRMFFEEEDVCVENHFKVLKTLLEKK